MKRRVAAGDRAEAGPALPAWKAFVVQFHREAGVSPGGPCGGRVEHLVSGEQARFESYEELLAILRKMLREVDEGTI